MAEREEKGKMREGLVVTDEGTKVNGGGTIGTSVK